MFCKNCGNQLADDASFCAKCGTPTAAAAPAVPVAPAEPEIPVAPVAPSAPAEQFVPMSDLGETTVLDQNQIFAPTAPADPAAPAKKKGPKWWVILLIVLGGLILALGAFVLVDGLANDGQLVESVIGVNFFESDKDDENQEDEDKVADEDEKSDKDKDEDEEKDKDSEDKDADKEEEDETEEDDEPSYYAGLRTEKSWASPFVGLQYRLPSGYLMATDEQIEQIVQSGADAVFADGTGDALADYSKSVLVYEFMAIDGVGNNLIAMAEKVPVGTSEKKVFDGVKSAMGAATAGYEITFSDKILTEKIGGLEFKRLDITTTTGGVSFTQTMFVRVMGDRAICFNFTYINDDYFEEMLKGFSAY